MKKVIYLSILFLLLPLSISAQAPGGHITRKKTSTTTSAPKKTRATPKKSTPAAKSPSSWKPRSGGLTTQSSTTAFESKKATATFKKTTTEKPRSAPAEMSQAQKDRIIQNLINSMVYVQGGTFVMGATSEQACDAYKNEKPIHRVSLSSFSIGRYEVTQEEWIAVMGSNPSKYKGSNLPVENVSWGDCQLFIGKLNALTRRQFRLPTEAEWEYAARGGKSSRGYKYSGSNSIGLVAWYSDNSSVGTHEVGTKAPNELGLYDMSGNVWEWCEDRYGEYNMSNYSVQTNPKGPFSGTSRVLRGGCWGTIASYCRVSYRSYESPSLKHELNGLRLAL